MASICFPQATGVPFASGPPVWWNDVDGTLPALNRRPDDPRWSGCTRIGLGAPGVNEDPSVRGLHAVDDDGKTWLHLSMTVRATNSQDPTLNAVHVGFQRQGGTALRLRAVPFPLVQPPDAPGVHLLALARQFVPPNSLNPATAPPWMTSFGRVFSGGGDFWAVHLRIPITHAGADIGEDGINVGAVGATFKFGCQVQVTLKGGGPAGPFTFPRSGFPLNDPSSWADATIGGTGCGAVVSIDSSQIRSDPPPDSTINFTLAGPPGSPNTLVASPLNSTGNQVDPGAIQARFYVANWGSQPNPNQASGVWTEVLPGSQAVNVSSIAAGANGLISLPWTVTGTMLTEFRTGVRWSHQCLLAELSGGGLDFSPSSAVRNMDFVGASTFVRDAQISVRGLPDPGTPKRDVYLLVKTTNMPARVPPPRPDPDPPPDRTRDDVAKARAAAATADPDGDGDGNGEYEPVYDPFATDLSGFDIIARDHPTYVVYAYHDTGEIDDESGLPWLAPQVAFGYVVGHDGELHGWEHELTGASLTLVGPDLYRLSVPTDGEAVVTTRIKALERLPSWWERLWRWLLAHLRKLCRRAWRKLRALLRR